MHKISEGFVEYKCTFMILLHKDQQKSQVSIGHAHQSLSTATKVCPLKQQPFTYNWLEIQRAYQSADSLINSLVPGRVVVILKFKSVVTEWSLWIKFMSTCKTALRWMLQNNFDDTSTSVNAMAWCHHVTSHYLRQYWPRSIMPCGITVPRWVILD